MSNSGLMFAQRRSALVFLGGCALVTLGVLLHLPMYWMGKDIGFVLSGMPMDPKMYVGMAMIVLGIVAAGYGLLPSTTVTHTDEDENFAPPEDSPLTRAHWLLMAGLAVGLIIDIMKPATLGFVTPGIRAEYHLTKAVVALFPLSALTGLTFGSFLWGWLADRYGRRAAILLSAVIFIGTSICGSMPSYQWNVFMCFLMGIGAGGMLPVAYALLAENMPTKHRRSCLGLRQFRPAAVAPLDACRRRPVGRSGKHDHRALHAVRSATRGAIRLPLRLVEHQMVARGGDCGDRTWPCRDGDARTRFP